MKAHLAALATLALTMTVHGADLDPAPAPSSIPRSPGEPSPVVSRAMAQLRAGDLREAETLFEAVTPDDPHFELALHNLGILYGERQETKKAVMVLTQLTRLRPEDTDAWTNLGWALYQAGEARQAVKISLQALALRPEDSRAAYNLALYQCAAGDLEAALTSYQAAIRSPRSASFFDEAMADAVALAEAQPDASAPRFALAKLRQSVGDQAGARRQLELVISGAASEAEKARARAMERELGQAGLPNP